MTVAVPCAFGAFEKDELASQRVQTKLGEVEGGVAKW